MANNIYILFICIIIIYNNCCADDSIRFNFIRKTENNDPRSRIIDSIINNVENYYFFRIYKSDSSLIECGVFDLYRDESNKFSNCEYPLFFIDKEYNWYSYLNNKKYLFYNKYKKLSKYRLHFNNKDEYVKIIKTEYLYGIKCYVYKFIFNDIVYRNSASYWFNPKYGFIKIEFDGNVLIREDILNQKPIVVNKANNYK